MSGTANPTIARPSLAQQIKGLDSRFWIVNMMEMFERLAYYGVRAVIAIYMVLPLELGGPQFTHIQKGIIFAWWAGIQSLLPMFAGGYADRYGHKNTVAVAIVIKIIGYVMMAHFMSFWGFFAGCMFLAAGTAIFKPGVQGTLAAILKKSNASVGWGIFYQLVNIGGFLGPVLAGILRIMDWQYVFYSCAVIVAINFFWLPFYADPSKEFETTEEMATPLRVLITSIKGFFRPRVFFFCIIFSGFWVMFNQVFDLLPNVIDDWVDSSGVIQTLGTLFSMPVVPTLIAALLAIVLGGVCAVGILLPMRPDQRPASAVTKPAYIVVTLSLIGALYLPFSFMTSGWGLLLVPVVATLFSVTFYQTRVPAKYIAWAVFAVGGISAFISMNSYFISSAPTLIQLAQDGKQVNPEWMINLNPGLIVFTMILFAYMTSFFRPLTSIILGIVVATVGSIIAGTTMVGWICIAGIAVFSIGEMLSSPKKMEYLASLSPKGQEGLYMGYVNFPVAIGWIAGSLFAGSRYEATGDKVNLARNHLESVLGMGHDLVQAIPKSEVMATLATQLNMTTLEAQRMLFQTYHPERIWIDIGLIGVASMVGMIGYDFAIRRWGKAEK